MYVCMYRYNCRCVHVYACAGVCIYMHVYRYKCRLWPAQWKFCWRCLSAQRCVYIYACIQIQVQVVASSVEDLLDVFVRQMEGSGSITELDEPPMPTWYEVGLFWLCIRSLLTQYYSTRSTADAYLVRKCVAFGNCAAPVVRNFFPWPFELFRPVLLFLEATPCRLGSPPGRK